MHKTLIASILMLPMLAHADTFIELDHHSKPSEIDYGLTMANVGAEACLQDRLCATGKVGTPVGSNDMGQQGRTWESGDVVVDVSVRYYFTR